MKTLALILLIVCGFPAIFGLSRFLEANQIALPPEIAEEDLTFRGETLKKAALGFDGLIADYYWMNALQYVGRKLATIEGDVMIDDLRALNPRLLYPLLDTATTLDPDFDAAYAYGTAILPAIDVEQAIKISEKGIAAQPENWRMYHNVGFIYWRRGDFKKAAEIYAAGAAKPNAAPFMRQMSARMQAEGGSRETARAIYGQILETAQDAQTRELAAKRLLQVDSFIERDAIRAALQAFQKENNRCAANWREVFAILKIIKTSDGKNLRLTAAGEPLDPSDAVYLLENQNSKCDVDLDWKTTKIPYR
jgi:tetratricopeptide (TPR) repeat protein